jgi:DNA-binding NarL/FixJ family response regulator
MASMDRLTTIRSLKRINLNVEILAISGLPPSDKVNAVYNPGIESFLCKYFTTNKFLKTISTVISYSRLQIN